MKKIMILIISSLFSLSLLAEPSIIDPDKQRINENPQECLKELQADPDQVAKQEEKEEPSWFEKLVKQHKLGSLHFQDLIEFFY